MAPARRATSVLIVIPTLNEAANIERVIASLGRDLPPAVRLAVVVVDGGSTDGTIERVCRLAAQHADVHLLHNPARIQSVGVNLAVRSAPQYIDVLVRCDAHAQYPSGYVRRLLETLDRTGADSVVVAMDCVAGETCFQRAAGWVSDTWLGSGGAGHRAGRRSGFVDHGHHAAFRMASFRRCGGYDETFTHNEDAELDCRLRGLGGRIFLDAGIRIGYQPRSNFRDLAKQYFAYGRGRSRTARRHPGSLRLRQLAVPLHFAGSAVAVAAAPWWPALLAWPWLYLAMLAAASLRETVQRGSPCGLLAGPAAGMMHAAWALGFCAGLVGVREERWVGAGHRAMKRRAIRP